MSSDSFLINIKKKSLKRSRPIHSNLGIVNLTEALHKGFQQEIILSCALSWNSRREILPRLCVSLVLVIHLKFFTIVQRTDYVKFKLYFPLLGKHHLQSTYYFWQFAVFVCARHCCADTGS